MGMTVAKKTALAKIAAARGEASVMLDADILGRHEMDGKLPELTRLAILDFNMKYPQNRIRHPFMYVPRNPGAVSGPGYLYCRFCGELITNVKYQPVGNIAVLLANSGDSMVANHVIRCALEALAGLRAIVPPGTTLLPREVRTPGYNVDRETERP